MDVPKSNPAATFLGNMDRSAEVRYEQKIVRYILARYSVSSHDKSIIYDQAEAVLGDRMPTMEIVEQTVPLPLRLRPRVIFKPTEHVNLASLLNGKALSGYLGQRYADVRDGCGETIDNICLCFGYPYLKTPGSANSLALHDWFPSPEDMPEIKGLVMCTGRDKVSWVLEPLGQLLDRLDTENS